MRLIDADALKGQIRETIKVYKTNGKFDEPLKRFCNMLRQEIEAIDNAPTIDAKPVKHGEWIMHIDDLFPEESTMECNQCHEHQPLTIDDNYCPNCGAKMDKE